MQKCKNSDGFQSPDPTDPNRQHNGSHTLRRMRATRHGGNFPLNVACEVLPATPFWRS